MFANLFPSLFFSALMVLSLPSWSYNPENETPATEAPSYNILDELNPYDPQVEEILNQYDQIYEEEMGESSALEGQFEGFYQLFNIPSCRRQDCAVWAQVVKSTQTMYLFHHGELMATWKVSTGLNGSTPNFDKNPNGRIYNRYTSSRYPGGDYKGLGNMPYAIFIHAGFAIHGTAETNWPKLGKPASHGCIRLHPDNAYRFNQLVRQYGIKNVWITVQP